MKSKIKSYFENLEPNKIGLDKKIKVKSVSKLGMGDANANFIVKTNQGNFVFRMSIQKKNDMDEEFFGLRALEGLNIAPKAWIHDKSKKLFEGSFIILSYIEGKICPQKKSFYTIKRIKKLGKLLGEVHNIKIKGNLKKLKRDSSIKGYGSYLDSIWRNYSGSLRRNVKNELFLAAATTFTEPLDFVPFIDSVTNVFKSSAKKIIFERYGLWYKDWVKLK